MVLLYRGYIIKCSTIGKKSKKEISSWDGKMYLVYLPSYYRYSKNKMSSKGMVEYSFSHFDLEIDIYLTKDRKRKIKNHEWVLLNNITRIGMPTVMKKIVKEAKIN